MTFVKIKLFDSTSILACGYLTNISIFIFGTFQNQYCKFLFPRSNVSGLLPYFRGRICYIFFPRVILYIFFSLLLIYGGLGFGVLGLGSYFGFLGLGLSVDGVWGLWCGAFWVFLVWALYINIKE